MEVIVQDANNIVIEVDQGRQGRGVSSVSLVTVGADYYIQFTFTDGTTQQVGPIATTVTEVISAEVRNAEAVTILKGQPVYLFQAQGNLATVKLAYNTSDATSAKTLGLAAENIAPNAQGLITCQGTLGGLNTSAYSEGDTLYLGATAGTLTNVKPQAPNHLVYIGVVERANAGAGQIYVRVQNGFELDEIHDVRIISPVNGNTLIYDASTSLWKNAGITAGSGISVTNGASSITVGNTGVLSFSGGTTGLTPATATTGAVSLAGTLAIANGGTGQTTANAALNALLPSQSTQAGKYLKTDGTNASWDQLDISTADITGILPTANGGTGLSSFTANGVVYASSASALTTGSGFTFANERLRVDRTSSGDVLYGTAFNANVGIFLERTGASPGSFRIIQTDAQESYFDASSASHKVIWRFNSVEQMRLNSTGLGIGTSSPSYKLHVLGSSGTTQAVIQNNTATTNAVNNGLILWSSTTGTAAAGLGSAINFVTEYANGADYDSGAIECIVTSATGSGSSKDAALLFKTSNSTSSNVERVRIDTVGNVGIGTSAPTAPLQFGKSVYGTTSSENFFRIKFEDAGGIQNDVGIGQPSSGAMGFNVDTSTGFYQWNIGTTTERMRLDVSGNLLVGTTTNTNSSRLTVNGTISETVSSVQYLVASQFDVGTAPNKIPLNQYLGNLAYQNASAIAGQVGFSAGTAALPSIASATDLTTGRWFPAAGVMAWSTAGTERMRLDASGNLGIGTTSSAGRVQITAASGQNLVLDGTASSSIQWRYSGTATAFAQVYLTSEFGFGTSTAIPLIFYSNNNERARLYSSGDFVMTGVGGLGYGTGSGGTITQATSRTTGVTLDKTNGAITLVSAAGTTAWQSFTVTNNKVVATDTVIVNQKSGTDLYQIFVTNVTGGSFRISFATTGGTTTEQPVFNFAVIKAVTA